MGTWSARHGAMTTQATRIPPRRTQSWPVRGALGVLVGVLIIVAMLRLEAADRSTASELDAVGHVALGFELVAYCVPPLLLARLVANTTVGTLTAARTAVAAVGVGNLVPGQPAPETLIAYRELSARGMSRTQSLATPLVMLVAAPAAAMALLAGPLLLISGAALNLPSAWRAPVITAGAIATVLGIALITLTLVRSTRARLPKFMRADQILETIGGPSGAGALLLLAFTGFGADALALYSCGRAVGAQLPIAALPVAYIVATVAIAVPFLPGGLGAVEVAVPLVFAAAGANYAHAALGVLAWRILQFWSPTLAGLACCASLVVERRRNRGQAEGPPVAGGAAAGATPR